MIHHKVVTVVYGQVLSTGFPVALIRGSLDSLSTLTESNDTYGLLTPSPTLITINRANHYGICSQNNPLGATPDPTTDPTKPLLDQSVAISRIAQWASLWFRAQLKGDSMAKFHIYQLIRTDDDDVQIQTN